MLYMQDKDVQDKDVRKDRIMFVTRDDHASPSLAEIKPDDPDDPYEEHDIKLLGISISNDLLGRPISKLYSEATRRLRIFHCAQSFLGLILPNGEINWNCPCLGGMASGPCSDPFKAAFSCFHKSQEDMRGSDCLNQFRDMQECMQRYPELYPQDDEPLEVSPDRPEGDGEAAPAKSMMQIDRVAAAATSS